VRGGQPYGSSHFSKASLVHLDESCNANELANAEFFLLTTGLSAAGATRRQVLERDRPVGGQRGRPGPRHQVHQAVQAGRQQPRVLRRRPQERPQGRARHLRSGDPAARDRRKRWKIARRRPGENFTQV